VPQERTRKHQQVVPTSPDKSRSMKEEAGPNTPMSTIRRRTAFRCSQIVADRLL
jgi:hypothetical protein